MRTGPRPLPVHIGMAASSFPGVEELQAHLPEEMQKMLLGIQRYQTHSYEPEALPLEVLWQEGTCSLSAIPGHDYGADNPAIILIPSLINKASILDLMPERSMLRWLAEQGINPYLLDWGEVSQDEGAQNADGVIMNRLIPAIEFLHQREEKKLHALGYCMGGTLLTGAAEAVQDKLASLVLLAAPWDFHAGTQALLNRVRFWAPSAAPLIAQKGVLPVDWMQMLFASLDPLVAVHKFLNFMDMDPESEQAKIFIAVEDWLNDGIDLPADLAQHCIQGWFLENQPMSGEWQVAGRIVTPENITCPVLIVASEKDRLVEFETAAVLETKIPETEVINPVCGHIGMIAGRSSIENVWNPIAQWVNAR